MSWRLSLWRYQFQIDSHCWCQNKTKLVGKIGYDEEVKQGTTGNEELSEVWSSDSLSHGIFTKMKQVVLGDF